MSSVAEWWNRAAPCRGTIGERFLRDHGVDLMPEAVVRFLPCAGFVNDFIAAPAVVLAHAQWPDSTPVALEVWPLAIDGRLAVRLNVETWADPGSDTTGAACRTGTPGDDLALTLSGLDALAATCRSGSPCWGVVQWESLSRVVLPPTPKARHLAVVTSDPPLPETVRRWRLEGREVGWLAPYKFWGGLAA